MQNIGYDELNVRIQGRGRGGGGVPSGSDIYIWIIDPARAQDGCILANKVHKRKKKENNDAKIHPS